jgi:hypothetical protein
LWGRQNWISAFPSGATVATRENRGRLFYLFGVTIAMLLVLAADLRYAAAPNATFGLAGILWIAAIALLLWSAFGVPLAIYRSYAAPMENCLKAKLQIK